MTQTTGRNASRTARIIASREATPEPYGADSPQERATRPPHATWSTTVGDTRFLFDEALDSPPASVDDRLFENDDGPPDADDDYQFDYDFGSEDSVGSSFLGSRSPTPVNSPQPEPKPLPRPDLSRLAEGRVLNALESSAERKYQFDARRAQKAVVGQWARVFPSAAVAAQTPALCEAVVCFSAGVRRGLFRPVDVSLFYLEVAVFACGGGSRRLREIMTSCASAQPHYILDALVKRTTGKRGRTADADPPINAKRRRVALTDFSARVGPHVFSPVTHAGNDQSPSTPSVHLERSWRPIAGRARMAKKAGPSSHCVRPPILSIEVLQYVRSQLYDLTKPTHRIVAYDAWRGMTKIARAKEKALAEREFAERLARVRAARISRSQSPQPASPASRVTQRSK